MSAAEHAALILKISAAESLSAFYMPIIHATCRHRMCGTVPRNVFEGVLDDTIWRTLVTELHTAQEFMDAGVAGAWWVPDEEQRSAVQAFLDSRMLRFACNNAILTLAHQGQLHGPLAFMLHWLHAPQSDWAAAALRDTIVQQCAVGDYESVLQKLKEAAALSHFRTAAHAFESKGAARVWNVMDEHRKFPLISALFIPKNGAAGSFTTDILSTVFMFVPSTDFPKVCLVCMHWRHALVSSAPAPHFRNNNAITRFLSQRGSPNVCATVFMRVYASKALEAVFVDWRAPRSLSVRCARVLSWMDYAVQGTAAAVRDFVQCLSHKMHSVKPELPPDIQIVYGTLPQFSQSWAVVERRQLFAPSAGEAVFVAGCGCSPRFTSSRLSDEEMDALKKEVEDLRRKAKTVQPGRVLRGECGF